MKDSTFKKMYKIRKKNLVKRFPLYKRSKKDKLPKLTRELAHTNQDRLS